MAVNLAQLGIQTQGAVYHNLKPDKLIRHALEKEEASLSHTGALSVRSGKYTGRKPDGRFFVKGTRFDDEINWGSGNLSVDTETFDKLYEKITKHLSDQSRLFVFDGCAGASEEHFMNIRVVNE